MDEAPATAPNNVPRDIIAQVHPTYDARLLRELRDLYVGGYEIAARASSYLPQLVGENDTRWAERTRQTAYIPHLGHIVDHFTSALFAQPLHARPAQDAAQDVDGDFYEAFANDADLASSSFSELCRAALTWALVQRRAIISVDFPRITSTPENRLDEERSGAARAYASLVPTEQLIDWEYETQVRKRERVDNETSVEFDIGWFKWVVLYRQRIERASPAHRRDTTIEQWKVWRRDEQTGAIVWELYESRELTTGAERELTSSVQRVVSVATDQASVSLVNASQGGAKLIDSGTTSFKRIPLVELVVPDGLWVGNKIGPMAKEHFQRRSIINASENRSLVATPYAKVGPEASAPGEAFIAKAQQDPDRGDKLEAQLAAKGYVVIGKDDELGYLEPKGTYATLAEERVGRLVDEMYRVAHLMAASVSSTSKAQGRSGLSKREDRHATNVVLKALGAIVRDFARRVYEVVSEGRDELVSWQISGIDQLDAYDRETVAEEAKILSEISVPSQTFRAEYLTQLAARLLPNLAPETVDQIKNELFAAARAQPVTSAVVAPTDATPPSSTNETRESDGEDDESEPAANGRRADSAVRDAQED